MPTRLGESFARMMGRTNERLYRADHWCSDFSLSASMSADWLRHSFVSLQTTYVWQLTDLVQFTEEIQQYIIHMQGMDFMHDLHIGVTHLMWTSECAVHETENLFAVLHDELEEVFGPTCDLDECDCKGLRTLATNGPCPIHG